ncbi:Vi polysaccharide biosynthesis UDP-N-acetylglucosamine C-6 dehydrogenase TviB [Novosphingobium jiangmenense]|uniref:Vi polysaccharide biosynthesis UDP-N-acetylglucosamine C-6 dehydrogenase TviB n=1 Tax=Novosphingobium jiangmenense TaxID=2791981 RepID=A0ABS0HBJ3_9SPHN|nr:Vi polysaccharide biosynthesis UDP-N-acetylglucosamine C-6 dehydrogenase TviB [Novosphingobium jiangmenense]MBF9149658.1 Vi polysaccharide biosynthesis UDP-N-acetylglucosamine C-6 dehydrogenase TviB [Novosphingobium jiangmenense]
MAEQNLPIAVIGLGYVGLPLATEFARHRPVIGFDVNAERIAALRAGNDHTREVSADELAAARHLDLTSDPADLAAATIFIVTVPTPIDAHKRPDLTPLIKASETVGRALKKGDIVIYESTVYPGATEEDCVPVLERASGLRFNVDFFCGYSPERINPGDKAHRLTTIRKVTSGSTPEVAEKVDALYASIITAGTYKAESIRVAEAAKVIENTQRDLNIALVNELAIIFNRMDIDTDAVLRAAGTKWNFLPFRPGLVGGHCIGVDPYYLTHKAESLGYHPQVILAGRRINDGMGAYVAGQMVKAMLKRRIHVDGARVLVLGLTFKENCPDLRNTRVVDVVEELRDYGMQVDVHDPWAGPEEARAEYGLDLIGTPEPGAYDGIVLAVAHDAFIATGAEALRSYGRKGSVFCDLKSVFRPDHSDLRL